MTVSMRKQIKSLRKKRRAAELAQGQRNERVAKFLGKYVYRAADGAFYMGTS